MAVLIVLVINPILPMKKTVQLDRIAWQMLTVRENQHASNAIILRTNQIYNVVSNVSNKTALKMTSVAQAFATDIQIHVRKEVRPKSFL